MAKPKTPDTGSSEIDKTAIAEEDTFKLRLEQAKAFSPAVLVISGKPLGKYFFLTNPKNILGRELTAEISLPESSISRQHVCFTVSESGVTVEDLGSTNGTFVNDVKIEMNNPISLENGDYVRCGNTILKYLKEGNIETLMHGQMFNKANFDQLTGAQNKQSCLDRLKEDFFRSQSKALSLSLLLFDLDHFKNINDTFGHPAGDFVLKELCSLVINKMIRQKDVLGRYGGEEFVLILPETTLQIAIEVAERIRSTIEKHSFVFDDKKIPVTISIGVSCLDSAIKSDADLLSTADKALYDAKNQGRNRVCVR